MRLLDLYCGAGGTAMGFHRAGFNEIVGIDIVDQPNYPFKFIKGDALEFALLYGNEFDMIVAGPPCKGYTGLWAIHKKDYPKLIPQTRQVLKSIGKPYVIENVSGARFELDNPIMLCGTMFINLRVQRHRFFECDPVLWWPPRPCQHIGRASATNSAGYNKRAGKVIPPTLENFEYLTVAGGNFKVSDGRIAMGIDWMTGKELAQAIPPAYTKWIGQQMIERIR